MLKCDQTNLCLTEQAALPDGLLWTCAGGKSLKISAMPSVSTLYFRSQMSLKSSRRSLSAIITFFSLPGFVWPRNGLFLQMNGSRRAQCLEKVKYPVRVFEMHQRRTYEGRKYFDRLSAILSVAGNHVYKICHSSKHYVLMTKACCSLLFTKKMIFRQMYRCDLMEEIVIEELMHFLWLRMLCGSDSTRIFSIEIISFHRNRSSLPPSDNNLCLVTVGVFFWCKKHQRQHTVLKYERKVTKKTVKSSTVMCNFLWGFCCSEKKYILPGEDFYLASLSFSSKNEM